MFSKRSLVLATVALAVFLPVLVMGGEPTPAEHKAEAKGETIAAAPASAPVPVSLSLEDCLRIALENNRTRPASKYAVAAAEAQYRQALAGWRPSFKLTAGLTQTDEPMNFLFPAESFASPNPFANAQAVGGVIQAANGGAPLTPAQTAALGGVVGAMPQTVNVPIPEKDIQVMDKRTGMGKLGMTFPLFTGGKLEGLTRQARAGLDAAREEARRTDLQVVFDTKRYFYAYVFARNLYQIAHDTMERLEVTLDLTERLYQNGSEKVKKTDYLRNKSVVEAARSMVAMMEANRETIKAVLVNTLGLDWQTPIEIKDMEIPFASCTVPQEQLINASLQFNPDWARLHAGLRAAEAKLRENKSGHMPKVALTGDIWALDSGYDKGMASPRNKHGWNLGIGLEMDIWDGGMTQERIKEARARLNKLQQEKILLREGLALMVKQSVFSILSSQKSVTASKASFAAAKENRELNVKAYQNELVETKDVIEAQVNEAFAQASYESSLFSNVVNRFQLEFVVGRELAEALAATEGK